MKKVFVVAMAVFAMSLSACSKTTADDFNSPAKVYKGS
jgi:hypothetical protein